ncbi:MAG: hypothetical protein AAF299_15330 [Pseudomonadota bacterium]
MYSHRPWPSKTGNLSAVIVCVSLFIGAGAAAQEKPQKTDCLDPSQVAAANEAYEAYCVRCHQPETLARNWFSVRGDGENAVKALARFLDNHGSCPHHHHELLARWLAEKADSN